MSNFEEPLFNCTSDVPSCLISFLLFPIGTCLLQVDTVDTLRGDGVGVPIVHNLILGAVGGAINRGKIREKLGIRATFLEDCLLHYFCSCCASAQEYREAKFRRNAATNLE
mmetsp:Transcript_9619/g.14326  ORF Transcript_9619/g.14326 Transcript_9619/m.14326 type:complete len:111 (-) Transcript_9619:1194-1526(-)